LPLLFTVADPMELPPSNNSTTPAATGALRLVTMAVKVTVSPKVAVDEDTLSIVVVGATTGTAGATVTRIAVEADAARFAVPAKLAVIESAPLGRVVRLIVATPLFTNPDPMEEPLKRKVTTPSVAGLPLASTLAPRVSLIP
jgi:hypothetical protein